MSYIARVSYTAAVNDEEVESKQIIIGIVLVANVKSSMITQYRTMHHEPHGLQAITSARGLRGKTH